jgi:hypothetical protein
MNRASLLSYYRLFAKSKPLWEQVLVKVSQPDAEDGRAISLQGTGDNANALAHFRKAESLGSSTRRFAAAYRSAYGEAPSDTLNRPT